MTVDLEDYFQVSAFEDVISRGEWDNQEQRIHANTDRLLATFDEAGVSATFFVLGWVAEKFPELVGRIHNAGHEIACHGFSHRLVFNQTISEFRQETVRTKSFLEDLTGCSVDGYRAASYSITKRSLWALDILVEAGFRYDSSIFPVHHDRYGIPNAPRHIFQFVTSSGKPLIEFPLSTAQVAGMRMPVAGGGYFRLFPYWLTRYGLRKIANTEKRAFIFYLHPWEIDVDQPRISAGLLSRFRHYTNLSRCESRLRRLLGDFEFSSAREVIARTNGLDKIRIDSLA